MTVRSLATHILIGLLTLCPFVCGAEAASSGAHGHEGAHNASAPDPCPDEGNGNCICGGAIQGDAVRVADPLTAGYALLSTAIEAPRRLHAAREGFSPVPPGPAMKTLGRAFLQNFRC